VSEGEEHHVKNDDEIDKSQKSQLKFEHDVCLLNYTIKIKTKNPKSLNWAFEVLRFFKNLGFKTQVYSPGKNVLWLK